MDFKTFTERRSGTYVKCTFDQPTVKELMYWNVVNLIPKPLNAEDYHSTILYSRKVVKDPNQVISATLINSNTKDSEFSVKATGFKLFDSIEGVDSRSLVILLEAPIMVKVHKALISNGGVHDYNDFVPHLTVSYNAPPNLDLTKLQLPQFKFKIKNWKAEPLNINWTST